MILPGGWEVSNFRRLGSYARRHVRDQALGDELLDVRPSEEMGRALVHAHGARVLGLDVAAVDVASNLNI